MKAQDQSCTGRNTIKMWGWVFLIGFIAWLCAMIYVCTNVIMMIIDKRT
jgi:hypothetical protein